MPERPRSGAAVGVPRARRRFSRHLFNRDPGIIPKRTRRRALRPLSKGDRGVQFWGMNEPATSPRMINAFAPGDGFAVEARYLVARSGCVAKSVRPVALWWLRGLHVMLVGEMMLRDYPSWGPPLMDLGAQLVVADWEALPEAEKCSWLNEAHGQNSEQQMPVVGTCWWLTGLTLMRMGDLHGRHYPSSGAAILRWGAEMFIAAWKARSEEERIREDMRVAEMPEVRPFKRSVAVVDTHESVCVTSAHGQATESQRVETPTPGTEASRVERTPPSRVLDVPSIDDEGAPVLAVEAACLDKGGAPVLAVDAPRTEDPRALAVGALCIDEGALALAVAAPCVGEAERYAVVGPPQQARDPRHGVERDPRHGVVCTASPAADGAAGQARRVAHGHVGPHSAGHHVVHVVRAERCDYPAGPAPSWPPRRRAPPARGCPPARRATVISSTVTATATPARRSSRRGAPPARRPRPPRQDHQRPCRTVVGTQWPSSGGLDRGPNRRPAGSSYPPLARHKNAC